MPPKCDYREENELWVPLQQQIRPDRMLWHDARFLHVIARTKPGITMTQASEDLNRVAAALRQAHTVGDVYGGGALTPVQKTFPRRGRGVWVGLFSLLWVGGVVLCAKVPNLVRFVVP